MIDRTDFSLKEIKRLRILLLTYGKPGKNSFDFSISYNILVF